MKNYPECKELIVHFLLQNPNLLDKNLHNIPKKKLSFRSVTNCVLRLIHSVKFNAEIPFSNVLTPQAEEKHHPGHGSSKFVSYCVLSICPGNTTIIFNINCVLRLIHSVKFNAGIPFSNVFTLQAEEKRHPGHGSSKFISNPIQ